MACHLASAWPEKVIASSRDKVHPAKNPPALEGGAQASLARPEPLSGLWESCSRAPKHVPLLRTAVCWTAGALDVQGSTGEARVSPSWGEGGRRVSPSWGRKCSPGLKAWAGKGTRAREPGCFRKLGRVSSQK